MATHSSILAWRIPMDRGIWWATVQGRKESDTAEWLSTAQRCPSGEWNVTGNPGKSQVEHWVGREEQPPGSRKLTVWQGLRIAWGTQGSTVSHRGIPRGQTLRRFYSPTHSASTYYMPAVCQHCSRVCGTSLNKTNKTYLLMEPISTF